MRWQPVALNPVLLLLLASAGLGQEKSCVELCRLDPLNVPRDCVCPVAAHGPGVTMLSPLSSLDMTARELLEREQAYYAERMAPIDNYWVVVKSNISPIEEVRYFEKEGTADEPSFRMIPINELAQRETLANPESEDFERMAAEDPAAVLGAFADAFDMIAASPEVDASTGGAASGLLGALADGFRDVSVGVTEMNQQMEEDREDEMEELSNLFFGGSMVDYRPNIAVMEEWALYLPNALITSERFGPTMGIDELRQPGAEQQVRNLESLGWIFCGIIKAKNVPFDYEGRDGTTYTVEHAEKWVAIEDDKPPYGVYIRIELRAVTAAGFQRSVIERETDRYRADGPLIPHRTRQRFSGAPMEVVEVVEHVQFNTGPPSQVEIAERTINSIGAVSGADPNVP